jgi:hypothetical protein
MSKHGWKSEKNYICTDSGEKAFVTGADHAEFAQFSRRGTTNCSGQNTFNFVG